MTHLTVERNNPTPPDRISPGEDGAAVTWTADFEPDGVTEEAAVQIVEGTIKLNLRLIEKSFSA